MRSSQIAGLIVVLIAIGGLVATKLSQTGSQRPPAEATTQAEQVARESQDFDVVDYYGGEVAETTDEEAQPQGADDADESAPATALPKLVELGSVGCMPCQLMKPIIQELTTELEGKVEVEVIDIGEEPAAADKYRIMAIPAIVWEDAEGNELDRHIGMMEKEEILDKMRELGMLD